MGVIFPLEGELPLVERQQAMIRNRHAMGRARQILQHVGRAAKRRFGIDHPLSVLERGQELLPRLGGSQRMTVARQRQAGPPHDSGGAGSGRDAETPDSARGLGGRRWGGTPATGSDPGTARLRESHSGDGDDGARFGPRYAAPRGGRCPRRDAADRVPQSGGSRTRLGTDTYTRGAGSVAPMGSGYAAA